MNPDWVDDPSYSNLELGAQCGNFGEIYFPKCYLSDFDRNLSNVCDPFRLHLFCDAFDLNLWKNERFEWIVMCNPHGYGFEEDAEVAQRLIRELVRVTRSNGAIFVLGHTLNKFCNPVYVQRNITIFNQNADGVALELEECLEIDSSVEYPGFEFYLTSRKRTTSPNRKMVIRVRKQ
jgi:hypothetical protein